jgi:hypothetical protein
MKFLEKDLETIIYESGRDLLDERGLAIEGKLLRQVKIGNYGIADLIYYSRPYYKGKKLFFPGQVTIIELKKEKIGIASFLQSIQYVKGVITYLESKNVSHLFDINIKLIGKELDTQGSFCFITDLLNVKGCGTIEFYTYDFKIDGINFNLESGYDFKNNGL